MAVTAKELAKKLNISESAVSLALNNKAGVSTATRKKVFELAKEMGYDFTRLNPEEHSPEKGSINFIIYKKNDAVVTDTPFFSQISEGISRACKKAHYFLNIHYVYDNDPVNILLDNWKKAGIKGLILLGTEMEKSDLNPFLMSGIPCVLLDNYFEKIEIDSILINNVQGAFAATELLIKTYKTQPGYLHSSYFINNFDERADGFYKAIRKSGMSTSRSIVHRLTPSVEGAYADMKELLANHEPLARCYFADNDLIAVGAMKCLKEAGYEIPKDIAIIGFDDLPLCTYIDPPLSTIHVPKQYMGQTAVERLAVLIEGKESLPLKIEVSTKLVRRRTV